MSRADRQFVGVVSGERVQVINDVGTILASGLLSADPYGPAAGAIAEMFSLDLVAMGRLLGERLALSAAAPIAAAGAAEKLLAAEEARHALASGDQEFAAGPDAGLVCWSPVLEGEARVGVLVVKARGRRAFSDEEKRAFASLSRQLATAIRNREFIDGIRAHSETLETTIRERTATLERQIRFTGQIIDSLPVSLYVVDRNRMIVAWNRQRELGDQGLLRGSTLGRSIFEIFDQQSKEAIETELRPVFERGESLLFERDSRVGGELRHYRVRKLPMRLEPGEVTHVLTIGEDITEQRRMEKSMVVTEKMAAMGRLAAGVAHEINNPLATIVTCAEGLDNRLLELPAGAKVSSEFKEYLQIVKQEAYRAKRITEDLLDFSRVHPSQRRVQGLEGILDRTLLILKHHDGFKRIEVERRFEQDLPQIAVEEDAIVQALVALIINALDAMPYGGRLRLTTSSRAGDVRCEVLDSGCGILPSDLPQIFEPFFTTKPPGRGTGLGLAVCYGIIKAHGGRIEVESSCGEGSRFTVVLPSAPTSNAPEEKLECSLPSPSGS